MDTKQGKPLWLEPRVGEIISTSLNMQKYSTFWESLTATIYVHIIYIYVYNKTTANMWNDSSMNMHIAGVRIRKSYRSRYVRIALHFLVDISQVIHMH